MRGWFRAGILLFSILAVSAEAMTPAAATVKTVYAFCPDRPTCAGGYYPTAIYSSASGDLYGIGLGNDATPYTTGFIFRLTHGKGLSYAYSQFFDFPSCNSDNTCPNGTNPIGLVVGQSGAVYVLTYGGSSSVGGLLVKITPSGQETVLHDFCSDANCSDGGTPIALSYEGAAQGRDWDEKSPLYGTAGNGTGCSGNGCGIVFQFDPKTGKYSKIYDFCSDDVDCTYVGEYPFGSIAVQGNYLYGVDYGLNGNAAVIYKLQLKKRIAIDLHTFPSNSDCPSGVKADGCLPVGGLTLDKNGNLSGLTQLGGIYGDGTLWTYYLPDQKYKQFDSFCDQCDKLGGRPISNVVQDSALNWFGATGAGGQNGDGTLFERYAKGGDRLLHSFTGSDDPVGTENYGVLAQSGGAVFWVNMTAGPSGFGAIYLARPNK